MANFGITAKYLLGLKLAFSLFSSLKSQMVSLGIIGKFDFNSKTVGIANRFVLSPFLTLFQVVIPNLFGITDRFIF